MTLTVLTCNRALNDLRHPLDQKLRGLYPYYVKLVGDTAA
jgi:hypothetical protein